MSITSAPVFALGITLAWLAGIRVYLTVFGLGLAAQFGWYDLPQQLELLSHPLVLGVSGALGLVEFFADKMPGVDSVWDLLHTVLRIPAGAFLANAAITSGTPTGAGEEWNLAALLGGGAVAALSHGLKSGTRALINHSPEPVSNVATSATEDIASLTILGTVLAHPWLALAIAILASGCFILAMIVLWRLLRKVMRTLAPS